jgi:hypothetical protein
MLITTTVRATTRGSFATEEIVPNTAPTALNQRVSPSRARRRHGDEHLTVRSRTQLYKPCTGTETEWQKGSLPERTQRKGNTTAALECRSSRVTRNGPEPSKERFVDRFFDCRSERRKNRSQNIFFRSRRKRKRFHKNDEIRK